MKKLIYTLAALLMTCLSLEAETITASFNLATYNLRNANATDSINGNPWMPRCRMIASMVKFHDFDIFGTQEGLRAQLNTLKAELPGYEYIGVGRSDGKEAGEHSAIFYNTDIFSCEESGNFWLSETPDVPGSKGWDAAWERICTWGRFRHLDTGIEFYYFNLHTDHQGKKARVNGVNLVLDKIREIAGNSTVFLSGDFNVTQHNICYRNICNSGILEDAHEKSDFVFEPNGTYNDWKPNGMTNGRIDHIFVSDAVKVNRFGVLTETFRSVNDKNVNMETDKKYLDNVVKCNIQLPSDHFPVLIGAQISTESTGVSVIRGTERPVDNRIFNLHGMEIKNPTAPGIYIRNGRKFIVH